MRKILILGGTIEARHLAERLAKRPELKVTVSLAGRTSAPVAHAVPVRLGGFGGAEGLAAFLRSERVDALIDATHPYAATISANAARAAARTGTRFLALRRPAWTPGAGDRWREAVDAADAARALGAASRRVFLALGRQDLGPFERAPQHHYLIRSVEAVTPPLALPQARYLIARGPFEEAAEHALLSAHRIDAIVCKNSGGTAAYGKIAAARALDIEVLMLRRPPLVAAPSVDTVEEAVAWLAHASTLPSARGV
jgi:precorrin-6A/cobalt-precorrin-6A reductase